jgi:hypothetical protein
VVGLVKILLIISKEQFSPRALYSVSVSAYSRESTGNGMSWENIDGSDERKEKMKLEYNMKVSSVE